MKNLKSIILLLLTLTVVLTCTTSCAVLEAFESLFPGRHVHTFADATCTAPKTCECGATEGEALGHNAIEVFGKAPTCTEPGQTNFMYCDVCGENLSTAEEIAPLGHTFVEGKCECGAEDPNYVPPHEHTYAASVTEPTCETAGYTTYTCACGHSYTANEVPATGHSYKETKTEPTCTTAGYTTFTCDCGHSYTANEVPATGHSYKETKTEPTCTTDGYTTFDCACGHSYTGNTVAALGHTPGEAVVENNKPADFNNAGSYDEVVYCTVCQAELSRKSVTVPPLTIVAQIGEQGYESLQAAIDAATAGQTIKLLTDISDSVSINKAIIIDGSNFTIAGTVTVEGHAGVETVQFINVKFSTDAVDMNEICVNILHDAEVIFTGCSFASTSSDRYYNGSKGIKISYNCTLEINSCTASKLYCMVDAQQAMDTGITVDNCTLTDILYGIGTYRCENIVIKNFTFTGMLYAICIQSADATLTLENINVDKPIYMFAHIGSTTGTYVINLKGTNVYNGTEILTRNDNVWLERENAEDPYMIKHIDHVDGEVKTKNEVAPTCTTPGSYDEVVYCAKCDVEIRRKTVTVDVIDHNFVDGTCTGCGLADSGSAPEVVPTTVSKTVKDLIAQYGWTSNTTKQSFALDDVVNVKINGGSNTGKAYDGDHIRIYATDTPAGTMTISVAEGYELVSIKVTTQTGTYAYFNIDGVSGDICNKTVEVSGSSVVLKSVKNGSNGKQIRVMAIEVVYQPAN